MKRKSRGPGLSTPPPPPRGHSFGEQQPPSLRACLEHAALLTQRQTGGTGIPGRWPHARCSGAASASHLPTLPFLLPGVPPFHTYRHTSQHVLAECLFPQTHNINIPGAESRDYINITKYISFSCPVSAEVMKRNKTNQTNPSPPTRKQNALWTQEK